MENRNTPREESWTNTFDFESFGVEDNVREIGHDEAENGDSTRRLRLAKAYLSEFYVLLEDAKNFARFSKNLPDREREWK